MLLGGARLCIRAGFWSDKLVSKSRIIAEVAAWWNLIGIHRESGDPQNIVAIGVRVEGLALG